MKKILILILSMISIASMAFAQFPGGGHPGGRPPMGGGHPGGRPPMGNFDPSRMDRQTQQVKQKKKVDDGTTFKLVGTLRDSTTKETIVYATVAVFDPKDNTMIKGGATDFDGQFEIKDIPAGEYNLRLSYIGYNDRYIPIKVTNNMALGTLYLKASTKMLKGVTVTAARPLYAMDGEKMIYNVAEDPTIQTGTTSDALQNAPGVEVDIEGNVTLRGVSSVEIWINDKPSKLSAQNLKTYLETLPANALDHIETITNPSAKYATEAEAVINIITSAHIKKNHFITFGVHGSSQPSISPWASYMWANDKLSVNLFGSMRYNYRENMSDSWIHKYDTTFAALEFDTTHSESENRNLGTNLFVNVNYTIDSLSEIEVHGGLNYNHSGMYNYSSNSRDNSFIPGGSYLYYADSTTNLGNYNLFGNMGATYTKKFDHEGHNLRIFANGTYNMGDQNRLFIRNYNHTTLYSDPFDQKKYYAEESDGASVSLNARYNRPYSKQGEMSYGLGIDRNISGNSYMPTYTLANGTDSIDILRQYYERTTSTSANADVEWTHRWGNFTLELGMGVNVANRSLSDTAMGASVYSFLASDTNLTYVTFSPSIHTSYRTEKLHNFYLNYTLRQSNPSASQLSTRRNYSEDGYSTGNPALKSSITHKAEAGWSKYFMSVGNIGLETYANITANGIASLSDATDGIDPYLNRVAQFSMPYNTATSYSYGISGNAMLRPSGFLNIRFYGNLYNSGYSYYYEKANKTYEDNLWSYSFRLNCWSKIMNKYQVFASARYTSPTQSLFATRKAHYSIDCGVRSDFFKRKLSVFIDVKDIFNWGKTIGGGSSNTNPFLQSETTSYTLNSRFISAGITLRFGKMELERNAQTGSDSTSE